MFIFLPHHIPWMLKYLHWENSLGKIFVAFPPSISNSFSSFLSTGNLLCLTQSRKWGINYHTLTVIAKHRTVPSCNAGDSILFWTLFPFFLLPFCLNGFNAGLHYFFFFFVITIVVACPRIDFAQCKIDEPVECMFFFVMNAAITLGSRRV